MRREHASHVLRETYVASLDARRPLRVGLFADSPLQPRWVVEGFAQIARSDYAEIVTIAERHAAPPPASWLWRAYSRIDRRVFGSRPDPSERIELQAHIPRARVLGLPDHDADDTVVAWRAEIASLHLDVAFALGEVDLLDGIARYGIWRYGFGEQFETPEPLAGFREVTRGIPVTPSGVIARLPHETQERLLYQSWSRTFPFSVARTRDSVLPKTSQFAGRALKELHSSRNTWPQQCAQIVRVPPKLDARAPELAWGLSKLTGRIARRGLQIVFVDQWFVACRFGNDSHLQAADLLEFTRLLAPQDRYWADPFPIARGGRYFIFFEEFMFAARKGHIVVVEVDGKGACSTPLRVLERDYHMSYPFLIEDDGELFMVPETGNNQTVELYRCIDFPHRWRLEKTLLRGARFVDATLHRGHDRWWMFVNVGFEGAEYHDELHLFWAKHLYGVWRAHGRNPVKSDVRCARPAGALFNRDGVLYRPAQICAPLYGSGISINRVLHLSPRTYLEQEEERILPTRSRDFLGIHTLNRAGPLTVVDGFMLRSRVERHSRGVSV